MFSAKGKFVVKCMDGIRICTVLVAPVRFTLLLNTPNIYATAGWVALEVMLATLVVIRTMFVSTVWNRIEVFGVRNGVALHVRSLEWWVDVFSLILFLIASGCVAPVARIDPYSAGIVILTSFTIATSMRALRVLYFDDFPYPFFFLYFWTVYFFGSIWYYIINWHTKSLKDAVDASSSSEAPYIQPFLFCLRDMFVMFLGEAQPCLNSTDLIFRSLCGFLGLYFSFRVVFEALRTHEASQILKESTSRRCTLMKQGMEMLPDNFERRILDYFYFVTSVQDPLHKDALLLSLSPTLKLELFFFVYERITTKTSFFYRLPCFLCKTLILALTDRFVAPGDYVLRKGELADETYFLIRGTQNVLLNLADSEDEMVAREFTPGDYFGETALLARFLVFSFMKPPRRTAWVRAQTYSHLAVLHNNSFDEAFEPFPDLKMGVARRIVEENATKHTDAWCENFSPSPSSPVEANDSVETDSPKKRETEANVPSSINVIGVHGNVVNELKMVVEGERRYYDDIVALKYEVHNLLDRLDDVQAA